MAFIQPVGSSSAGIQNMGSQAAKDKPCFLERVGAFINGTVLGRLGAKAGHHSLLGQTFKIGMSIGRGILSIKKPVAAENAQPVHTHTFQELSGEKAREMMPSVNASKLANGKRVPDGLKQTDNNFGQLIAVKKEGKTPEYLIRHNILLNSITQDLHLTPKETTLFNEIKSICSQRAYISPTGVIVDPNSGLRAAIVKTENEDYIISFGSTGSRETTDENKKGLFFLQYVSNIDQYLGFEPNIYDQAKKLTAALAQMCGKDKVSTAGHSLGGGLAQYAALHNGVKGKCFNGSPLGTGLQKRLGNKIQAAPELISHISTRGDWLSYTGNTLPIGVGVSQKDLNQTKGGPDTRPRYMSKIADLIGLRTRGNFGKKYYINFDKELSIGTQKMTIIKKHNKKAAYDKIVKRAKDQLDENKPKKEVMKEFNQEMKKLIDWDSKEYKDELNAAIETYSQQAYPRHADILFQMSALAKA